MESKPPNQDTSVGWFEQKENIRRVLLGLFAGCTLLIGIDVAYWISGYDKHPYFKWETWPGFYAVYGFVACVVLVLVSKLVLRPLVMRDEQYYDSRKKGGHDV